MTREFAGDCESHVGWAEVFDADRLHRSGSVHRIGDVGDAIEWARVLQRRRPYGGRSQRASTSQRGPDACAQEDLRPCRHRATPKATCLCGEATSRFLAGSAAITGLVARGCSR